MRPLTEPELSSLEDDALSAEKELETQVAELEADRQAVLSELREVRLRLEDEQGRGTIGLDGLLSRLSGLDVPALSLVGHAERMAEVRADHARARIWLTSALRQDLDRFTIELGHVVGLADEGRAELQKVAEQPRVNPRARAKRLMGARAITDEFAGAPENAPRPPKRRQQPRLRFEVVIDLHSRSNFYTGVTENISEGGLFVATDQRPPLGTAVEIAFSLPPGEDIRGRGLVQWTREPGGGLSGGIGIGFDELSSESRAAIDRFLASRAPIIREP